METYVDFKKVAKKRCCFGRKQKLLNEKKERVLNFPFISFGYSLGSITAIDSFKKGSIFKNPFHDFIVLVTPGFRASLSELDRNELQ